MGANTRIIKSDKKSEAGIIVDQNEVSIVGDKRHFIVADQRGVTIRGPVSFASTGESTRRGGMFVGLNDFMDMLPSTLITPLPKNIQMPPYYMMANVVLDLAYFLSMMV